MTPASEHKPHSTRGYTDAQRQADGIRQLVGYIVNETPQNDDVDEYERKIDKWLDVWVEKHDSLEEQLEAAQQALRAYRAIFVAWEGLGSITLNEEALRQWKSIADSVLSNSASEPTPLQRAYGGKVRAVSTDASNQESKP